MQREGVSTMVYWSETTKLLNKTKDTEEKTKIWRQKQSHSIIAPVTQGNRDASHLQHMGGAMNLYGQEETVWWSRDETELGFHSQFAAKFRDLGWANDCQ